jgi:carboxypeptidase Taq
MSEQFDRLRERLAVVHNLNRANSVLGWDQHTYMPPGGSAARGEQMATIGRIAHEMLVADETGELIRAATNEVKDLPRESDDASLVRVAQRDYDHQRKIPADLVAEMTRHAAEAFQVWARAREENKYPDFAPYLKKTVEYSCRVAELLGYEDRPYDALLDIFEPGMKTAQVESIFEELKKDLVPLVRAIAERRERVDDSVLHQPYDEAKQESFGKMVAQLYGYDFTRGRLDRTVHPFETSFSRNDVRITTRYESDFLNPALFSTLHETGHGLYEQNVGESLEGSLLASGASHGLHESQSRMWENVVGRSRGFWEHFYPQLQQAFPEQLKNVDLGTFYKAVNKVDPSLIRVEADEVTYNLHIMLRFEMELALLEGSISVDEAPEAWNQKMQSYLGIVPPTDSEGILQDIHWSSGLMGYFTTYSLGNILSIQLFDMAVKQRPEIPQEIGHGQFNTLRGWLEENLYRHGRKFEPNELVERITGEPIQSRSYMRYLKEKFGEIYELSGAGY